MTTTVRRNTRTLILAIALPLLLIGMLLASVSPARGDEARLPALIVNNDEMVEITNTDGTTTNVVAGRLLVSWLTNPANANGFNWQLASADTAQQELDAGTAYVVLTVPENFSAAVASLGSADAQQAKINIVTDQAHDYLTGDLAQRVLDGMVATFGRDLTQQVVLGVANGVEQQADGLDQAGDGAAKLADGANQLGSGFDQYADGVAQAADGTQQAADGAGALGDGATSLADGASQLAGGVGEVASGANSYAAGVGQYRDGIAQYVNGVTQLASGLGQLDAQGSPGLRQAAEQLRAVSGQLQNLPLGDIKALLQQVRDGLAGMGDLQAPIEQLRASCQLIPDATAAASCVAAIDQVDSAIAASGLDLSAVLGNLDAAIAALDGNSFGQLGQLADGIEQYVDGVSQSAAGAGQLAANGAPLVQGANDLTSGATQLAGGASQLSGGANQLAGGASQFADGTNELVTGLNQLADGQQQLVAGADPLASGIQQLSKGAGTMATELHDGAQQARDAMPDPEQFADTVSAPVTSSVSAQRDPGLAGVLAALAIPVAAWLAGLVTMLRRRMLTQEALDSSASNWRLLGQAARMLVVPVSIVTAAVALLGHVFGAPWLGLAGTLLFAALAVVLSVAAHLALIVLFGRGRGAAVSLALLGAQLVFARALLPLELRPEWASIVETLLPIPQLANGLQALYAGGTVGSVVGPALIALVMAAIAAVVAIVAVGRRRRTTAAALMAA